MGSFTNLLGKTERTEEEINYFSCDRNVKSSTPPAFLWHTAEDGGVPVMNSLLYAAALSRSKVPFELHVYPYGGHGSSTCDSTTIDDISEGLMHASAWMDCLKKWLKLIGISY